MMGLSFSHFHISILFHICFGELNKKSEFSVLKPDGSNNHAQFSNLKQPSHEITFSLPVNYIFFN